MTQPSGVQLLANGHSLRLHLVLCCWTDATVATRRQSRGEENGPESDTAALVRSHTEDRGPGKCLFLLRPHAWSTETGPRSRLCKGLSGKSLVAFLTSWRLSWLTTNQDSGTVGPRKEDGPDPCTVPGLRGRGHGLRSPLCWHLVLLPGRIRPLVHKPEA